ncbi:MAG: LptF/LptG family permease [bacterium]
MKLIDKYIFKQIALATIMGVLIFIVFWISPEILIRIIRQTMNGQVSPIEAIKLFFLEIPEILSKAIPVGLMLGSLFVFDKLSRDSELIIIRSVGVSLKRLLVPVLVISSFASILCFFTYDYLIPSSEKAMLNVQGMESTHFVYVDKDKENIPKKIFIVGNFDNKKVGEVKFLTLSKNKESTVPEINEVLTADYAKYSKEKWTLYNGYQYEISDDGVYKEIHKFTTKDVLEGTPATNAQTLMKNSIKKPTQMTLKELSDHYNLLASLGIEDELGYFKNKIHQRFSMPFSCILFGLCGVILGYGKPREHKFIGLIAGICLVFLYFITMPFIDMLAEHRIIYPVIAAWLPNMLVLGTTISFLKYRRI